MPAAELSAGGKLVKPRKGEPPACSSAYRRFSSSRLQTERAPVLSASNPSACSVETASVLPDELDLGIARSTPSSNLQRARPSPQLTRASLPSDEGSHAESAAELLRAAVMSDLSPGRDVPDTEIIVSGQESSACQQSPSFLIEVQRGDVGVLEWCDDATDLLTGICVPQIDIRSVAAARDRLPCRVGRWRPRPAAATSPPSRSVALVARPRPRSRAVRRPW